MEDITKMVILWVVASCSLIGIYRRFEGVSWLHNQGDERTVMFLLDEQFLLKNLKGRDVETIDRFPRTR